MQRICPTAGRVIASMTLANCALNWPAGVDTVENLSLRNACHPGCLCNRHARSADHNDAVPTGVVRLLNAGRPSTVAEFVIAVVVDALQREAGRSRSHVEHEIAKRSPSLANRDPSATVAAVRWVARILAALTHTFPTLICRRTAFAVGAGSAHTGGLLVKRGGVRGVGERPWNVYFDDDSPMILGFARVVEWQTQGT